MRASASAAGYVKSRSSNSFSSSMKDFIRPIDVKVSNCGTVTVRKIAVPESDQDFAFTTSPDLSASGFSLDDDGNESNSLKSSRTFQGRFSGTLEVTEEPAAGWDLTDVTCTTGGTPDPLIDGLPSPHVSIEVEPGESVDCTYTNTARGRIRVFQAVLPAGDPQSFDFLLAGGPEALSDAFALQGGSTPHDSGSVRPGTYSIAQTDPGLAWDLQSATCDDGSPVGAVSVAPGETVNCTFVDVKRGQILVDETTVPSGDAQAFPFALTGGPDATSQSFSLTHAAAPHASGLVRAGTYAASQSPVPSGWDLTSATCDDGSSPAAVGLSPGETVTCTFVHTKRGGIVIDEVTIPSGDPQAFAFSLTGGPDALNASFSLTDAAAPYPSADAKAGTYAASQSPLPAGWDLTSATCSDGSSPSAIALSPGEVVTCTFTHTKRGRIVIDEVTNPSGDPQSFPFTLTGGPDALNAAFSLTDAAAPYQSVSLRPGTYAASQSPFPAGWDFISATCDDGSSHATIALAPGEVVTCTFRHAKRGTILVDVVTTPSGDPQTFGFSLTGGPVAINQSFSLKDTSAPHSSGLVRQGTYAATPAATPAGWDLVSSSCSDGSAPGSIGLAAGESVTCTFNYVKRGHVLVDVTTLPAGSSQAFSFSFSGGPDAVSQSFSLTDAAAPHDSGAVRPGTYAATAGATPAGWDLVSSSCSDGSAPGSIGLSAGESVTCTFAYVKRGRIVIDEVTNPSGDPQSFPFTLTGGPDSLNASFSLTDAAAPYQSVDLRPGTYRVSQYPFPAGWDFVSAVCDDGSSHAAIVLSPGEVVTCTYRHTKRGNITVIKDARPNHAQNFSFTMAGPSGSGNFSLDDDADPTLSNSRTSTALVLGAYTVSEGDPGAMWDNTGIACASSLGSMSSTISLPARSASFTLRPGETVTCTFVNVMRGRITVIKMLEDTTPGSTVDPKTIPFAFTGGWGASFALKHGESHTSPWILSDRSYAVTETPNGPWRASSVCVFPDGSQTTGGASINVTPPAGGVVLCTFTNALRIHPGSSGFWRNWSNHYSDAQLRMILLELRGSPIYATLFDASGALRSDAISIIDAIYSTSGDSDSKRTLKELTSTMLNLVVSTSENPAVRALQNNDDVSRDTLLRLTSMPGVEEMIRALAPCDFEGGVRIGDVIDIAEAAWNGDVAARIYRFDTLSPSQLSTLGNVFERINDGAIVVVDPDSILTRPRGLPIGGPTPHDWFLDGDGDGFGGAPVTTCDDTPQAGYSANDDDCDDTRAAVYPGAPEVCDGRRNDCNASGWPALGGLETDNDHDGAAECGGDCNDANPAVFPGAAEACNAVDDDCNGMIDDDGTASDADGDGLRATCDNCPLAANPGQSDADHDGIGDACDICAATADLAQLDTDDDGVGDACDNCKSASNQLQIDADLDGLGDVCDNCADALNPAQSDFNHDGEGDLCDVDDGLIYLVASTTGGDYLEWQQEFGFGTFSMYKGSLAVLKSAGAYTQAPGSNPLAAKVCNTASNSYPDAAAQSLGSAAFYLVTGKIGGVEGSLGTNSQGVARPNTNPCP